MRNLSLGFFFGIVILPLVMFCYFRFGHPPVAVADHQLPFEKEIVKVPMSARIDAEMPKIPPIQADELAFTAGARIYREQCAVCHGTYGQSSTFGEHMFPKAPYLWRRHGKNVVGVSDDPPGETYWKVANGIRLTGMPSFNMTLSETEMWQVTLLLSNADKPMPDSTINVLKQPLDFSTASGSTAGHPRLQ